jgi:hypothetical protein
MVCYDGTVFTGIGFIDRIFKQGNIFCISIRDGKVFFIWTVIMHNKYSDGEGG